MEKTDFFIDIDNEIAALISIETKSFINKQCNRAVMGVPGKIRYVFDSIDSVMSLHKKLNVENIAFDCFAHSVAKNTLHELYL